MSFGILSEIASTLKRNKLRTFLTGFSISWGIFMLILLLAAGNGLKNGVSSNFGSEAKNIVYLYAGQTSKPYKGYPKWRSIQMDSKDSLLLANGYAEIDEVIPVFSSFGKQLFYHKKSVTTSIKAVIPKYKSFDDVKLLEGRFINELDMKEFRKVIVLADKDAIPLFGTKSAIGKNVVIDKIVYTIIGLYKSPGQWQNDLYIPFSTAQKIYNPSRKLEQITFSVNGLTTPEANRKFNDNLRGRLSKMHIFDPEDENAIFIWNQLENYLQTIKIFNAINMFVWIIGIGTLIAGIVGVGNIMLITVRERTKEFGIRKALGARPSSILRLIIFESLIITGVFGYIGMVLGIAVSETVSYVMEMSGQGGSGEMSIFKNPTVDLGIVIAATVVLIIAGVLAGYFPAKKAVSIKPIEALRYE
jgi:putative ABC transport system permease protein